MMTGILFLKKFFMHEGRRIRTPVSISYWVLNPARLTAPAFPHWIILSDSFNIKSFGSPVGISGEINYSVCFFFFFFSFSLILSLSSRSNLSKSSLYRFLIVTSVIPATSATSRWVFFSSLIRAAT